MNRKKDFFRLGITGCILALEIITVSQTLPVQAGFWSGFGVGDTEGTQKTLLAAGASSSGVLISEVMFSPPPGGHEWVELKNVGSASVDISGLQVSDEDGNIYTIPEALPGVPPGGLVLIRFDGAGSGSNDYDFSDNLTTLHSPSGMVDIFHDSADQCSFRGTLDSSPSTLLGFVAWGDDPGLDGDEAAALGIWGEGMYLRPEAGAGVIDETAGFPQGGTIGLGPGCASAVYHNWTNFQPGDASPGAENPTRSVPWIHPASGATIDASTFSVSWASITGATGYWFEMDDNADFSSPQIELTLPYTQTSYTPATSVAEGTYYWRVKAVSPSSQSPWTPGAEIKVVSFSSGIPSENIDEKSLGIEWQLQHKDTIMLCLDGCNESGACVWDQPHITRDVHGDMYCSRASASMLASYYGGALSQDRLTYYIFGGGDPEGDLGHNVGASVTEIGEMLEWALGTTITGSEGIPTFDQVKYWIDGDRPIYSVVFWPSGGGHARLIDGYRVFSDTERVEMIHLLDPWDSAKWISYAHDTATYVNSVVSPGPPGPDGAPDVRSDEDEDDDGIPDTIDDSDGDGVCDFDERYRFGSSDRRLNPLNPDTDGDLVQDENDIRGYMFDPAGNYDHRQADFDDDGLRKEIDPNNDYVDPKAGYIDGCEDANHNGRLDSGESSNFDAASENPCRYWLPWVGICLQ